MKVGRCLPVCGCTCRAYPPPRPTVGTGPASECGAKMKGTTSLGVNSLADYFHNNHPCRLRSAPQGMKRGDGAWWWGVRVF